MPSLYEPCGLTQLYAMRYGTLPLVYTTGGLNDTVTSAIGYRFYQHDPESLLSILQQALADWHSPVWLARQTAAMQEDSSWTRPAAAYAALYAKILG